MDKLGVVCMEWPDCTNRNNGQGFKNQVVDSVNDNGAATSVWLSDSHPASVVETVRTGGELRR